jgi:hypothetical protein
VIKHVPRNDEAADAVKPPNAGTERMDACRHI